MVEENFRRFALSKRDYTLIQRFSTDTEARRIAARRRYHLLVIDGDHSYEGVKNDFQRYRDLVVPGGYVVFDDYGNDNWPDVKRYVDAEVRGRSDVREVGIGWRTVVFRTPGTDPSDPT